MYLAGRTIARLGLGDRGSATRLPTGNGAAAASRGTNGGATGTTPTCGAGGASTIESSIGSTRLQQFAVDLVGYVDIPFRSA